MKKLPIIFLCGIFFCISCSGPSDKAIIQSADSLATHYPDSALSLLKHCLFPENLPDAQRAAYGRIFAKCCLNTNKSFTLDTLLPYAIQYYTATKDTNNLFDCIISECRRQLDLNNKQKAIKISKEAIGLTSGQKRLQLYSFISDVSAFSNPLIMKNYAEKLAHSNDPSFQALGYYNLYLDPKLPGSTPSLRASYLDSCLIIAEKYHVKEYPDYLRNGIYGVNLGLKQSVSQLKKSLALYGLKENSNIFCEIGILFLQSHQLDSASYYTHRAIECYKKEWTNQGKVYLTLRNQLEVLSTCLSYAQGKMNIHENSYIGLFNDSIYTAQELGNKIKAEEAWNRQQGFEKELTLTKSKARIRLLLVSFLFLAFLLAIGILFYIRKRRNLWIETSEKLETLQKMLREVGINSAADGDAGVQPTGGDSKFFKRMLLQQLGVIKMMATKPTENNMGLLQQMTRIAHEEVSVDSLVNWNDLYSIIDNIYQGFYSKLVRLYGDSLTGKEIQICCLLCADFSTKEISIVTEQSLRTVYQRKSDIRRKLKMPEKEDIVCFIKQLS